MVKIAARTNVEGALAYFLEDPALTETERHGRWVGNLAEALQIDRNSWVDRPSLERGLRGFAPCGPLQGLELFASRRATPRIAWELVFTPHKSVSIAAVQRSDRDLAVAVRGAVATATYRTLRETVCPLIRARTRIVAAQDSASMLGAAFAHTHSRRLDPHYHLHILILNTTYHAQIGWRRLEPRSIFREIRSITGAFDDHLAQALRASNLPFERREIGSLNSPVLPQFLDVSPTLSSGSAAVRRLAETTVRPPNVSPDRWAQRLNNRSRPKKQTKSAMLGGGKIRARNFLTAPEEDPTRALFHPSVPPIARLSALQSFTSRWRTGPSVSEAVLATVS